MGRPARPGVLRVGDRVRFDGAVHTVVGLAGAAVRLAAGPGGASVVALAHLLAAGDFELLDSQPAPRLPPFALLDTLPEAVVARARWWERHVVEVETACRRTPRRALAPTRRMTRHGGRWRSGTRPRPPSCAPPPARQPAR
jgi:hypothetical protein